MKWTTGSNTTVILYKQRRSRIERRRREVDSMGRGILRPIATVVSNGTEKEEPK